MDGIQEDHNGRYPMGVRLFLSGLIFFVTFCLGFSYPTEKTHYYYQKKVGKEITDIELILEETENNCLLTCKSFEDVSTSINDKSLSTLEWSFTKPDNKSAIKVKRDGDFLIVNGIFKGKEIHDRLPIDGSPWYQATSLSLRNFVFSTDQEMIFWTVLSDNLNPVKFRAIKEATESIKAGDACYDALRIGMRPSGLISIFWKGVYWFSIEDGVLLKFQGPVGLPGSAISEIVFVDYKDPMD